VVQRIRPPRIEYHQIHALIAGRIDIFKNSRNFYSDGLTTMTDYLCQASHQVVVRWVGQVAIEPTLLDMDTIGVDLLAAGTR